MFAYIKCIPYTAYRMMLSYFFSDIHLPIKMMGIALPFPISQMLVFFGLLLCSLLVLLSIYLSIVLYLLTQTLSSPSSMH